jgi:rubrerythrin
MFETIDDVIDFAIEKEQAAEDYYIELARRVSDPRTRQLFEHMAGQEKVHKRSLQKLKNGFILKSAAGKVSKLTGYVAPTPRDNLKASDLTYQNALMLACERETSANKLYSALAEIAEEEDLVKLFQILANEESEHHRKIQAEFKKQTS